MCNIHNEQSMINDSQLWKPNQSSYLILPFLSYLMLSYLLNKNIMVNEYVLGNKGGWEVINSVVTLRQALVLTLNPKP